MAGLITPFLPFVPGLPQASGGLGIGINASMSGEEAIDFHIRVSGTGILARGGPLKGHDIGPLDFSTSHAGRLSPGAREVEIKEGEIKIQKGTSISWKGTVKSPAGEPTDVHLALEPRVNLTEIYRLAKSFVPEGISMEDSLAGDNQGTLRQKS